MTNRRDFLKAALIAPAAAMSTLSFATSQHLFAISKETDDDFHLSLDGKGFRVIRTAYAGLPSDGRFYTTRELAAVDNPSRQITFTLAGKKKADYSIFGKTVRVSLSRSGVRYLTASGRVIRVSAWQSFRTLQQADEFEIEFADLPLSALMHLAIANTNRGKDING
jgi:hypothetical protein